MSRGGATPEDPFAPSLGGDWKGRPPRAENPMTWSLPLFRLMKVEIRIHALFLALILVETARSAIAGRGPEDTMPLGMGWTLYALCALWFVVLLHEFAHCVMARCLGGAADEILMWPLGGLATTSPPNRWQAHLLTALAGPLASGGLFVVCAVPLWLSTHSTAVVFPSLFRGGGILDGIIVITAEENALLLTSVFLLHCMNSLVLLANLLPILPFDGARILHAALWSRVGYVRAMKGVERVGVAGAVVLAVVALLWSTGIWSTYLIAVAFFCGLTSLRVGDSVAFTEEELGRLSDEGWAPVEDDADVLGRIGAPNDPARIEADPPAPADPDAEVVDLILEKIKRSGLGSLTRREHRVLRKATRQRRKRT